MARDDERQFIAHLLRAGVRVPDAARDYPMTASTKRRLLLLWFGAGYWQYAGELVGGWLTEAGAEALRDQIAPKPGAPW